MGLQVLGSLRDTALPCAALRSLPCPALPSVPCPALLLLCPAASSLTSRHPPIRTPHATQQATLDVPEEGAPPGEPQLLLAGARRRCMPGSCVRARRPCAAACSLCAARALPGAFPAGPTLALLPLASSSQSGGPRQLQRCTTPRPWRSRCSTSRRQRWQRTARARASRWQTAWRWGGAAGAGLERRLRGGVKS